MLTQFNKIVLIIAIIVLIIMLSILAFFLSKTLYEDSYPPIISDCPDYWDVSLNSNNQTICIDNLKINPGLSTYNCRNIQPEIMFKINNQSTNIGSRKNELCNKYDWASKCKITWDGITNNTINCDN